MPNFNDVIKELLLVVLKYNYKILKGKTMVKNEIVMNRAIALAEKWQNRARELVSDIDKMFHIKMNKM